MWEWMGKHPEKLPLQNWPIQMVSSYGDEQRQPINALMLSLGNNLSRVMCECALIGGVPLHLCLCVCMRVYVWSVYLCGLYRVSVSASIRSVSSVFRSCVGAAMSHTNSQVFSDRLCTLKTKAEPLSSHEWQINWWPHEFITTISYKHTRYMLT